MLNIKNKKGLTSNKITIIISVIIIFFLISLNPFVYLRDERALSKSVKSIEVLLQGARDSTISSGSSHGVFFKEKQVILFKNEKGTYLNNKIVDLSNDVVISEINLAGKSPRVIFKGTKGETNQPGNIVVSLISDNTKFKVITIFSKGTFLSR